MCPIAWAVLLLHAIKAPMVTHWSGVASEQAACHDDLTDTSELMPLPVPHAEALVAVLDQLPQLKDVALPNNNLHKLSPLPRHATALSLASNPLQQLGLTLQPDRASSLKASRTSIASVAAVRALCACAVLQLSHAAAMQQH